uniref:Uncharacterized protein n=1 Tax=Ditylenchus dipsaci TaxID=166011 RepID=A0A915EV38_9BILA
MTNPSSEKLLAQAVEDSNLSEVVKMYSNGVEGSFKDAEGNNILHIAVKKGSVIAIKAVILLFDTSKNLRSERNNESLLPVDLCNADDARRVISMDSGNNLEEVDSERNLFQPKSYEKTLNSRLTALQKSTGGSRKCLLSVDGGGIKGLVPLRFNAESLEKVLKEHLGMSTMGDIENPKVIVTSAITSVAPAKLKLFRNFYPALLNQEDMAELGYDNPTAVTLWKAARCSSAAPLLFPKFVDETGIYSDGGIVANNPTMDLLCEFERYQTISELKTGEKLSERVGCVLSLGCGISKFLKIENSRVAQTLGYVSAGAAYLYDDFQIIKKQITLADGVIVDRCRSVCRTLKSPFFRFSPKLRYEVSVCETNDVEIIELMWDAEVYAHRCLEELVELALLMKSFFGELPSERWSPTQNVRNILLSVISLLCEPQTSVPANMDASANYLKWKDAGETENEYAKIVRSQVISSKKRAEKDNITVPETDEEYREFIPIWSKRTRLQMRKQKKR